MAEYRVICVVRGGKGEIRAVGYSRNGNGVIYDDRWSVGQVREAIAEGHRLYVVDPSTGEQANLELRADDIRVRSADGADNSLVALPECG